MSHAYTEDTLVEAPAKWRMSDLGWSLEQPHPHRDPLPGVEEALAWVDESGLFGCETKSEVVLVSRLSRPFVGLERLSAALPPEAITAVEDELSRDLQLPLLRSGQVELDVSRGIQQSSGAVQPA